MLSLGWRLRRKCSTLSNHNNVVHIQCSTLHHQQHRRGRCCCCCSRHRRRPRYRRWEKLNAFKSYCCYCRCCSHIYKYMFVYCTVRRWKKPNPLHIEAGRCIALCIEGLVYFHYFYHCYDIRLCVHITRNCSLPHLLCCAFFAIPYESLFSLYSTKFSSPVIVVTIIIFSVLPYLFPLILYVPVFSTHISHFLREKKIASVFELCCAVHIQFSSLYDAEIAGRDSSTLQYLIK